MKALRLALLISFTMVTPAWADVPGTMDYQAYITDAGGAPLDGTVSVRVVFWADESDDSQDSYRYGELHSDVQVDQGLFSVQLGTGLADNQGEELEPSFFADPIWLEISINGEELVPRRPFASTAYSFRAQAAEEVGPNSVAGSQVIDHSLTGNDIADGSLSQADISDSAVVEFSSGDQEIYLSDTEKTIRSVTLDAPSSGTILANASGTFLLSPQVIFGCSLTTGLTLDSTHLVQAIGPNDGEGMNPISLTRAFPVGPGATSINLVCAKTLGESPYYIMITDFSMTALFVPGT